MSLLLLTRRRSGAGGGSPVTGTEHLILEASAILGKSDGDTVGSGEWPDASANGFTGVTSGTPAWKENRINGHPTVQFVRTESDLMRFDYGSALAQPLTILSVVKATAAADFAGVYDGDAAAQVILYQHAGSLKLNAGAGEKIVGDFTLMSDFALWRLDLTASTDAIKKNGVDQLTGSFGSNTPSEMVLGGNTNGSLFTSCEFAAQVVLAGPGAAAIAAWENYLTTKYGLG